MRRPAFLGLKTNLQNYHSSEVWLGGLDRFHCFPVMILASKWGCLYGNGVRKMVCWSGVYYGHIAKYCLGEWYQARNANSVVLSISIIGSSLPIRQAISTVFHSIGLCMRALLQPRVAEVLGVFRHIEDDFIFHSSKQTYVPDLTCLQTLVTILVTDLFANTRHHRRHWPLCEHSSSPSTYINRRLGFLFNADNTPCLHNK